MFYPHLDILMLQSVNDIEGGAVGCRGNRQLLVQSLVRYGNSWEPEMTTRCQLLEGRQRGAVRLYVSNVTDWAWGGRVVFNPKRQMEPSFIGLYQTLYCWNNTFLNSWLVSCSWCSAVGPKLTVFDLFSQHQRRHWCLKPCCTLTAQQQTAQRHS